MNEPRLQLAGVHHSARPTWKLRETHEFYRDILGLPLVHCVSARGWGPSNHPDFLHFFFDSGNGSTIAFFYYLGTGQPDHLVHRAEYDNDAIHTAWRVDSREMLLAWRKRLEDRGVKVLYQIEHEVIESVYFRDPNGYYLEIACPTRGFLALDAEDAALSVEAALEVEDRRARGEPIAGIAAIWQAKGRRVAESELHGVCVFVPDLPEFAAVVVAAQQLEGCRARLDDRGYWRIEADAQLRLDRKAMKLGPALWYSLLSGGYAGRIVEYGRDRLVIDPA